MLMCANIQLLTLMTYQAIRSIYHANIKSPIENAMKRQKIKSIHQQITNDTLKQLSGWVIDEAIRIQQIPAPTFDESQRAQYVTQRFVDFDLERVDIDPLHNVYGCLPATNATKPALMISAHIDTVFSKETNLATHRDQNRIYGPGLGDNSVGVAGMLGLIKWLSEQKLPLNRDLWFVATSREEGLGDLGGIREAYNRLKTEINQVVNLEGLAYGYIFHQGIAVKRLKISAKTDGGHSWIHFGQPNAIHELTNIASFITQLHVPTTPRTTYNIGVIQGGTAINALATEAQMLVDFRSEDQNQLQKLIDKTLSFIEQSDHDGVTFTVEVVGNRPSGGIPTSHELVQQAIYVLDLLNIRAGLETGSTDANIPLADGCPAITVGITQGANAHRLDEYMETVPVRDGMHQLLTLISSLSTDLS